MTIALQIRIQATASVAPQQSAGVEARDVPDCSSLTLRLYFTDSVKSSERRAIASNFVNGPFAEVFHPPGLLGLAAHKRKVAKTGLKTPPAI